MRMMVLDWLAELQTRAVTRMKVGTRMMVALQMMVVLLVSEVHLRQTYLQTYYYHLHQRDY